MDSEETLKYLQQKYPEDLVGLKQIKDLIFNSDNDNMKKLFNTYKSKRQFVKDFNSVPITSIGDNKTLV